MPTRHVALTERQATLVEQRKAKDKCRLDALRSAVQTGIADIEGGRYRSFEAAVPLRAHLSSITEKAVSSA